jgi:hypothetical protein
VESGGGGGYGPPRLRAPAARAADLDNGVVTRRARPGRRRTRVIRTRPTVTAQRSR